MQQRVYMHQLKQTSDSRIQQVAKSAVKIPLADLKNCKSMIHGYLFY